MQCELISHLRVLLLLMSAVVLILSAFAKSRIAKIVSVIAMALNFMPVAALYMPASQIVSAEGSNSQSKMIKVMQFNLCGELNKDYTAVLNALAVENPDVIGFSEIPPPWLDLLKTNLKDYRHVVADTRYGGIAIFSRLPFNHSEIKYYGDWHRPRAIAEIMTGGGAVSVVCAHPSVPNIRPELRNGELKLLAEELRALSKTNPTVLIGDLNCTPWSYYFSQLLQHSDFVDTEQGFGFQPTFSAFFFVPLVTIDHCLVSRDIGTITRRTGTRVGSDHLPVTVTLALGATAKSRF